MQRLLPVLVVLLALALGWTSWGWANAHRRLQALAKERQEQQRMSAEPQDAGGRDSELRVPREPATNVTAPERTPAEREAGPDPDLDPGTWLVRFAPPIDGKQSSNLLKQIAALPPEDGLRIMTALWATLEPKTKAQAITIFAGGHPFSLDVLHLAATDADVATQSRAFDALERYAFQDFSEDYQAYLAWRARWAGHPLAEVLVANGRELVARLSRLTAGELSAELSRLQRIDLNRSAEMGVDLVQVLRDAGGLLLVERWLGVEDPETLALALRLAGQLDPDEGWLRANVLARLGSSFDGSSEVTSSALGLLARPECVFAQDDVVNFMDRRLSVPNDPDQEGSADVAVWSGARALAGMGDPASIPRMIAMIAREENYNTVYGVGYFGLGKLTGVEYDERHGADWWITWWEQNRARFPPAVQAIEIHR